MDLIIDKTKSSCGCTVVQLTEEEKIIPPGGYLDFTVNFNSTGRKGLQNKLVSVYTNDPAEPVLKLEFTATVNNMYEIDPPKLMNLRGIRRGAIANRTIDLYPGYGYHHINIVDVTTPAGSPLEVRHEPYEMDGAQGGRVFLRITESAALGSLISSVEIQFKVDGVDRIHEVPIRGEIVGDLTWRPREIGKTRHPLRRGKRLSPVTLESTESIPFDIVSANAGPLFDVVYEARRRGQKKGSYSLVLTLREDAISGPFGTLLEIRTTILDQPIVRIPIFGLVAPHLEIDPPIVLLVQDGTARGTNRRIKLQASSHRALNVTAISCEHPAIRVELDQQAAARYPHIRYLKVQLRDGLPRGTQDTVITLVTNVLGAERVEIPVTVTVP